MDYESPCPTDDEYEEREFYISIFLSFKSYKDQAFEKIKHTEDYLDSLSEKHQDYLATYRRGLDKIRAGIETNYYVITAVLTDGLHIFENHYLTTKIIEESKNRVLNLTDSLDKVQVVFKQLYRDWTEHGFWEREQCFRPILNEIEFYYPTDVYVRSEINILVPGSGLGRLPYEIASRGFHCQGNEFNGFLLIMSHFVLNCCYARNQYEICPWILQSTNNFTINDQTAKCKFPDILPDLSPDSPNKLILSMAAGDFADIYNIDNIWDCIATSFFIDCAPNIVEYIEIIWNILTHGGLWINIGPLTYHFADVKPVNSIEPSFEVLCQIIEKIGFKFLKKNVNMNTKYCQNENSMSHFEYSSVFFVCRKPFYGQKSEMQQQ